MSVGFSYPGLFEVSMTNINERLNSCLNNTYHKYAVTGEKHLYWTVKIPPPAICQFYLSAEMKTMMRRTGGVFNPADARNRQTWHNIFEYYGTHYANTIELGGEVHMETQIDSHRLRTEDITYMKRGLTIALGASSTPNSNAPSTPNAPANPANQATPDTAPESGGDSEATRRAVVGQSVHKARAVAEGEGGPATIPGINWGVSFSIVRETYRKMLDDNFRESTRETISLVGGHQNNMRPDQWREWVPTIIQIPEVLNKRLTSIVELLVDNPDVPNSENIRSHWENALEDYRQWWITEGRQQAESGGDIWKKRTLRNPLQE
eukprot:TRINITY_DN158_c0_g1_i1.p2 TRINITY_DN158_c0_g1~~TRINITY_DN158_c0_g1_i1.p2  ORF type:complete len:332 (-),score=75.09 TRINITY_DN158_c0_g1_i1:2516-3478(-)